MSYAINFVCRASKVNKRGLAPIEMYVIINKERAFVSLPRKEEPETFKKAYNAKRGNEIKNFCMAEMAKVQEVINEMVSHNKPLNVLTLKEYINNGYCISYRIADLFRDFLALQEKKIEVKSGDGGTTLKTFEKYKLAVAYFKEYIATLGMSEKNDVTSITNSVVVGWQRWLTTEKKMQDSTKAGYMSKFKTICKFAYANGKITKDPFYGIKIKKGMKEVETITEEEYAKLAKKHFSIERLEKVRKLLVVAGSCGLAFCDIVKLAPMDFVEIDGHLCLNKERGKTNVPFFVVIMPEGEKIIRELNMDLTTLKLSNQKINSYAKEIQDICGITSVESLHYYLFRHFFARRLINSGMDMATVSKCLGHSSTALTAHYAKMFPKDTLKRVIGEYKKIFK